VVGRGLSFEGVAVWLCCGGGGALGGGWGCVLGGGVCVVVLVGFCWGVGVGCGCFGGVWVLVGCWCWGCGFVGGGDTWVCFGCGGSFWVLFRARVLRRGGDMSSVPGAGVVGLVMVARGRNLSGPIHHVLRMVS